MTDEQAVQLDNFRTRAEGLFKEAAERQRTLDAWEVSTGDSGMPMGAETLKGYAEEAVAAWRAKANELGVLTAALESPDPVEGEPEGLSDELSLLYRQFMVQVAEANA